MSALLPMLKETDIYELNVNAEYGMITRRFNKNVNVSVSDNYKSAMFLVYTLKFLPKFTSLINQRAFVLPNRRRRYRNHFTMFGNRDTLIIARSETTLIHADTDAIIMYDIIKPKICSRATITSTPWVVSFDTIDYTNAPPKNFATFDLISSGEWWYFDRGVILNGVTAHSSGHFCNDMLVYYELHAHNSPSKAAPVEIPPVVPQQLINISTNNVNSVPNASSADEEERGSLKKGIGLKSNISPELANVKVRPDNDPLKDSDTLLRNRPCLLLGKDGTCLLPDRSKAEPFRGSPNLKKQPSFETESISNRIRENNSGLLGSGEIPALNAHLQPTIVRNDSESIPETFIQAVIPSASWFDERHGELSMLNISYFLPVESTF